MSQFAMDDGKQIRYAATVVVVGKGESPPRKGMPVIHVKCVEGIRQKKKE